MLGGGMLWTAYFAVELVFDQTGNSDVGQLLCVIEGALSLHNDCDCCSWETRHRHCQMCHTERVHEKNVAAVKL
jgi:recombinational DNA repair protein RecR